MDDDNGEKSELPSQKKIRDALKKGNVAKSKDVTNTVVLIGVCAYLLFCTDLIFDDIAHLYNMMYQLMPNDGNRLEPVLRLAFQTTGKIMITVFGIAMSLAILAMVVQVGFNISGEPVKPSLNKVNPVNGFKRLVKMRTLFEVAKSVLALGLIGTAVYLIVHDSWADLAKLPATGIWAILDVSIDLAVKMMSFVLPLFILKAAADYLFQRHVWLRDLHMTKDEVKRERKDQDGDPTAKSERKRLGAELMAPDNLESFEYASLVLRDSSGALVALYYNAEYAPLPLMLLKAQGPVADDLFREAHARQIRIVHDDDLTRMLVRRCRSNDFIPAECATEVGWLLREKN